MSAELLAIGPRAKLIERLEQLVDQAKRGEIKGITYCLIMDSWACRPRWFGVGEPGVPLPLLGYAMRSSVNYLASAMDTNAASGGAADG